MRRFAIPSLFAAALLALVFLPAVAGAFFLYDDFAIVALAPRLGLRELLTSGPGGFFRPAAVLLFGLEARVFGWTHPAGYAAVSLALHAGVAGLLALVLRRMGARREEAGAGFALFLASPWAGEAFFWTSAQFDLLATAAFLATCLLGLAALDAAGARRALLSAAALASGGVALLSKESAAPLPVLFLLVVAARRAPLPAARLLAAAAAALGLLAAGYLLLRSHALPGLEGPYGRFGDLVAASHPLGNAARFARAFAHLPGPRGAPLAVAAAILLAALWSVSLGRALVRDAWRAAALLLGLAAALAPVVFTRLEPGSTAGGRLLYLPGVFAVLLFVLAWRGSRLAPATLALVLALSLPSLLWQRRLWSAAADLSRGAIGRLGAVLPAAGPIRIPDLPSTFEEGPYVLKGYAFRFYFGGRLTVPVRAEAVVLGWRDGRAVALRTAPDPFSDPPRAGETTLRLDLVPAAP